MSSPSPSVQLRELFSLHHGWLTRHLVRRAGDRHDAEDVCADTFCELLFRHTDLTVIQHPRAFLARIGQRLLYRRYRERELERACLEILAQSADAHAPSPEELILLVQSVAQLDAALHGLPLPVRMAFFYNLVDGLSHDDIAARLRVSSRTVARYLKQALTCCRDNGVF